MYNVLRDYGTGGNACFLNVLYLYKNTCILYKERNNGYGQGFSTNWLD